MAWMAMIPGWLVEQTKAPTIALLAYLQVMVEDVLPDDEEIAEDLGLQPEDVAQAFQELLRLGAVVRVGDGYGLGSMEPPSTEDGGEDGGWRP